MLGTASRPIMSYRDHTATSLHEPRDYIANVLARNAGSGEEPCKGVHTRLGRLPAVLTIGFVAMWLLLNQSLAPGQILLGAILAVAVVWATAMLRPLQPHIRKPRLALVLPVFVLVDIPRSNIAVARIVLGLVRNR